MLKVKHYDLAKNRNAEVEQWQNDIKNSIKSFYLQKKRSLIEMNNWKKKIKN